MDGKYESIFDIIGPVMVGPSSSHTAGAARIGKVVRKIFGERPCNVDIYLYGSFAKTYRGHGTDIALVGGLLGMEPSDERLPKALDIAKDKKMKVTFIPADEKVEHPNTVKMIVKGNESKEMTVLGTSIGGGKIQISELNGFKIQLDLNEPTFLIIHRDAPGVIAEVARVLSTRGINVATMMVSRESKGERAIMVIEVDQVEIGDALSELRSISNLYQTSFFK